MGRKKGSLHHEADYRTTVEERHHMIEKNCEEISFAEASATEKKECRMVQHKPKDAMQKRSKMKVRKLFGEGQLIHEWLANKSPRSVWFPLKLLDAVLRGFSQVVFANNTLSGLCVVIGLAVADGVVCAAGFLAATLSTLMAVVFCQSWDSISNGLMTYNGVLVGTVTASLCPSIVKGHHGLDLITWGFIVIGAIMSPLLTSAVGNLCKVSSLPALTLPFNLVDLLIFVCMPSISKLAITSTENLANNVTIQQYDENVTDTFDWALLFKGSLVSMGQVYAVESIVCSSIMYAGILLYSPLLCISLFIGSFLGCVCGTGLVEKYAAIYSGLWGYNTALTAAAIAVTFYVPSFLSALSAIFAIVFTAATQLAVSNALAQAGLPPFTIPFVVASFIFLGVSTGVGGKSLVKTKDGRPPECQLRRLCEDDSAI